MNSEPSRRRRVIQFLQEYSVFLLLGVALAVIFATIMHHFGITVHLEGKEISEYAELVEISLTGSFKFLGHTISPHWIINDVFMVFFFGIAAKEITEAMLPGGALNPPAKAMSPLIGTLGGVLGPIGIFFVLVHLLDNGSPEHLAEVHTGWGIPTATDIALAWLAARVVFGNGHPAINFLLLLAIADDAIGLVIIAVFYPDPLHPVEPLWLLLVVLGMVIAFILRKKNVRHWQYYIFIAGTLSWIGLLQARLHPALALVPIVPFLPSAVSDTGLFNEEEGVDHNMDSALQAFEHSLKLFVDVGLLFFGLTNAGVAISADAFTDPLVYIIFGALMIGKPLGITLFAWVGHFFGAQYPTGLTTRHIFVAGIVGALGLTVALFVAGVAYEAHPEHTGPAKMGALLSGFAGIVAFIVGRIMNAKHLDETKELESKEPAAD